MPLHISFNHCLMPELLPHSQSLPREIGFIDCFPNESNLLFFSFVSIDSIDNPLFDKRPTLERHA